MAVMKQRSVAEILKVLERYHITLVGENRIQEAQQHLPLLPLGVEKHFIGHLQTNKVKTAVALFDCIETIDSLKLAGAVNSAAVELGKRISMFLQVNISNDPAKYGFLPKELVTVIEQLEQFKQLELMGLMTITAQQDPGKTRIDFRRMKALQTQFGMRELSMGMSDDWQIAVEEGATIIRLGRVLFEG